jgi:hypothetical protein
MAGPSLPYLLVAYCFLAALAMPATPQVNISLDDTDPAIRYLPLGAWRAKVAPRDGFSYNRTWHEAGCGHGDCSPELLTMEFDVNGSAIYLYSLQSRRSPSSPSSSLLPSQVSISLDGQAIPSNLDPVPDVISLCDLSNTHHNVIISVETGSSFLFDYLIYTTASDIGPAFVLQDRQNNSTTSTQTSTSSLATPSVIDSGGSTSGKAQAGAISGAIAASIGITSLFLVGLAISIIKIRGERARVQRERHTERDRNGSRGLDMYLPSPPGSRRPARGDEPPSYDTAMGLVGASALVVQSNPAQLQDRLSIIEETPIEEAPIARSSDGNSPAEGSCSLDGMPPPPPGLHAADGDALATAQ